MTAYRGFCFGGYASQAPHAANERTVNWTPQRIETPFGNTEWALYPTPGVRLFTEAVGQVAIRGAFEENGRCFFVGSDTFFEVDAAGGVTARGTVATDPDLSPASITSNGDGGQQLFLTVSGKGYVYDLQTNVLTEIIAANAGQCDMLDGFVVVLDTSDSTLMASLLFDASSFPALSHEQRASKPDPWLALRVVDQQVYAIGERSTDIYYNAGLSPFPFALAAAGAIPWGIAAPHSLTKVGSSLIWLARSADSIGAVVQAAGSSAREVSNHALRLAIRGYRDTVGIDDAIGMSYEEDGHTFYVLTFPAADATWVLDVATGLWTERLTWNQTEGRYTAWRPHWHVVAFGKHLVGDRTTGKIYELTLDVSTDVDGQPIRRLRRAPALFSEGERFTVRRLEVHVQPGLGTEAAGQGSRPTMMLSISRDLQRWHACAPVEAGAIGEYATQVDWTRLGTGRYFQPEIVVTDPIPWRIAGATVEVA